MRPNPRILRASCTRNNCTHTLFPTVYDNSFTFFSFTHAHKHTQRGSTHIGRFITQKNSSVAKASPMAESEVLRQLASSAAFGRQEPLALLPLDQNNLLNLYKWASRFDSPAVAVAGAEDDGARRDPALSLRARGQATLFLTKTNLQFQSRNSHGLRLSPDGLTVVGVDEKSEAENAGVRKGWQVTHVDGEEVALRSDFDHILSCATGSYIITFRNKFDFENITVRLLHTHGAQRELKLDALPADSIRVLKLRIEAATGIPSHLQRLFFLGVLCDPNDIIGGFISRKHETPDDTLTYCLDCRPLFELGVNALTEALDVLSAEGELPHIRTESSLPHGDDKTASVIAPQLREQGTPPSRQRSLSPALLSPARDRHVGALVRHVRGDTEIFDETDADTRIADDSEGGDSESGSDAKAGDNRPEPMRRAPIRVYTGVRLRSLVWQGFWDWTFQRLAQPEKDSDGRRPNPHQERKAARKRRALKTPRLVSFESICGVGPPRLSKFHGTFEERHWETVVMQATLGVQRWFRDVVHPDLSSAWLQLVTALEGIDGPDVFWDGVVLATETATTGAIWGREIALDPDFRLRFVPNTSDSGFGTLRVFRTPFHCIYQFEDSHETMLFTRKDESLLRRLIDANESGHVRMKRKTRLVLRGLDGQRVDVECVRRALRKEHRETKHVTFRFVSSTPGDPRSSLRSPLRPPPGCPGGGQGGGRLGCTGGGGDPGGGSPGMVFSRRGLASQSDYYATEELPAKTPRPVKRKICLKKALSETHGNQKAPKGGSIRGSMPHASKTTAAQTPRKDRQGTRGKRKSARSHLRAQAGGRQWNLACPRDLMFESLNSVVYQLLSQAIHGEAQRAIELQERERESRFREEQRRQSALSHQFWWEVYQNDQLAARKLPVVRHTLRTFEPQLHDAIFVMVRAREYLDVTLARMRSLSQPHMAWWFLFWLDLRLRYGEVAPDPVPPDSPVRHLLGPQAIRELLAPINAVRLQILLGGRVDARVVQAQDPGLVRQTRSGSGRLSIRSGFMGQSSFNNPAALSEHAVLGMVAQLKEHGEIRSFWARFKQGPDGAWSERAKDGRPWRFLDAAPIAAMPESLRRELQEARESRRSHAECGRSRLRDAISNAERVLGDPSVPPAVTNTWLRLRNLARKTSAYWMGTGLQEPPLPGLQAKRSDDLDGLLTDDEAEQEEPGHGSTALEEEKLHAPHKTNGKTRVAADGPVVYYCGKRPRPHQHNATTSAPQPSSRSTRVSGGSTQHFTAKVPSRPDAKSPRLQDVRGFRVGDRVQVFSRTRDAWISAFVAHAFFGPGLRSKGKITRQLYLSLALTGGGRKNLPDTSAHIRPAPEQDGRMGGWPRPSEAALRRSRAGRTGQAPPVPISGTRVWDALLQKCAVRPEPPVRLGIIPRSRVRSFEATKAGRQRLTVLLKGSSVAGGASVAPQHKQRVQLLDFDGHDGAGRSGVDPAPDRTRSVSHLQLQRAHSDARKSWSESQSRISKQNAQNMGRPRPGRAQTVPLGSDGRASAFSLGLLSSQSLLRADTKKPLLRSRDGAAGARSKGTRDAPLHSARPDGVTDLDSETSKVAPAVLRQSIIALPDSQRESLSGERRTWRDLFLSYESKGMLSTSALATLLKDQVIARCKVSDLEAALPRVWSLQLDYYGTLSTDAVRRTFELNAAAIRVPHALSMLSRFRGAGALTMRRLAAIVRDSLRVTRVRCQELIARWDRDNAATGSMTAAAFKNMVHAYQGNLVHALLDAGRREKGNQASDAF